MGKHSSEKTKRTVKNNIKTKRIVNLFLIILFILIIIGISLAYTSDDTENLGFLGAIKSMLTTQSDTQEEVLPREKLNFNYGWQFSKGEGYNNQGSIVEPIDEKVTIIPDDSAILPYKAEYIIDEQGKGLNGETWENVSLPHTYNDVDTFNNFNELGGGGQNGERSMYTGTSWYKKTFTIPQEYKGKRIYIEFEAARQAAKVYLNGNPITGTSENGFIAFGYDLTQYINYNGENEITVMVDNSFKYEIEGTTSTIPWNDSHWHPTYGGLYRNSFLYIMDDLHLTLPLYSFLETEGTYIYTSDETATTAKIHVNAQIENSSEKARTFTYIAEVKDADGNTVLTMESPDQTLQPNEKKIFILSDTLQNAKRWSDEYPYLYTVVCKVVENGLIIDNNENELGIRTVRFTTNEGMYLNENYTVLNGWGQKSTGEWAGLGSAYPDWMQDYVIKLMKEAGSNYTRYGHTAGGPEQIKASNRYGILVLQPGVDSEGNYGGTYTSETYELRENAFRDLIIYFRNNPSIIMWEMGNQSNITEACMKNMYNIVNQYDYGNRGEQLSKTLKSGTSVASSQELVSDINITSSGVYENTTTQSDRLIAIRQGNPTSKKYVEIEESTEGGTIGMGGMPVIEGEYNRLEARRGVWDKSTKGYENFQNTTTVEGFADVNSESFAVSQVEKYASIISKIQMNGVANWIFSDTISHGRLGSEVARASGEVDAVMLPKESYWVCKVLFSKEPGIHMIGHWNYEQATEENKEQATVKNIYVVAKGASTVELQINGTVVATNSEPTSLYLYTFKNITYEKGTIKAIAKDSNGNEIMQDEMVTDNTPHHLKITPIVSPDGLLANGSDVLLLDVEVVDKQGNRCESFDGVRDDIITTFTINDENGASIWRGGYNSSIENSTNNKHIYIESGITRVAVRTTMQAGQITVTAETPGLESATVTVESKEVDNTNGYCKTLSSTIPYSLSTLEYQPYGDGTKRGDITTEDTVIESDLIRELTYTGETKAKLGKALGADKKIYQDLADTFDSVPYSMQNSEYVILNNANNGDTATDLLNFVAKKEINVYILRDPNVKNPQWLEEFTKQKDIVTAHSGTVYDVYKRTYQEGDSITLGGNSDSGLEGQKGYMYIVAIKSKSDVDNGIFYNQNFDSISDWILRNETNAIISQAQEMNNNIMHFNDTSDSQIAYMYSEYPKLTGKFKFSYRLKLDSTVETNKWIRTWLTQGYVEPQEAETKDNVLTEVYLNRDTTNLTYREYGLAADKTLELAKIPSLDTWNTYEYVVNTNTHTFDLYINNESLPSKSGAKFWRNLDSSNYIVLGTGKSSLNNFWVDDVIIEPVGNNAIKQIKVNGTEIEGFNELTKSYRVKGHEIVSANEIEVVQSDEYLSSNIQYTDKYATVTVTDKQNSSVEYIIYFEKETTNKTELRSLISKVNGLKQEYYTEGTWNQLIVVMEEAQSAEQNETVTNAQILPIIASFKEILQQLKFK